KTAQRLIAELTIRASEIDADPRFIYGVTRLAVFGSYVSSDKPKLGDIDIAVELGPKEKDSERFTELLVREENDAPAWANMFEKVCWPQTKVCRALRAGHSSISLHEYEELEKMLQAGRATCIELHRNPKFDREPSVRLKKR